jgi:hypothetical protein
MPNYTAEFKRDLHALDGQELGAVYFVRDYVQLVFDDATLTCVTNPVVAVNGREVQFPASGSRDLMCSLIDRTISAVALDEAVALELIFGDAGTIRISLREEDQFSPQHDPIWL